MPSRVSIRVSTSIPSLPPGPLTDGDQRRLLVLPAMISVSARAIVPVPGIAMGIGILVAVVVVRV